VAPELVPVIEPIDTVSVVLRRDLPPVEIVTSLDATAAPGDITYFSIVHRVLEDGSRELTTLLDLGLVLTDNELSGRPSSARQIGRFEVEIFAVNELGGDAEMFTLDILSPTLMPNFDGNGTTDILFAADGTIRGAASAPSEDGFDVAAPALLVSGIANGADLHIADFNGDSVTDVLEWDATAGRVRIHYANTQSVSFTTVTHLEGILTDSGEAIIDVADLDGDGNADILWRNSKTGAVSVWRMKGQSILWAGFMHEADFVPQFVMSADFSGGGGAFLMWRDADGSFLLERATVFRTSDGMTDIESLRFKSDVPREPLFATDFNADGRADLVWYNPATGAVSVWLMNGLDVPAEYFVAADEEGEVPTALAGVEILPPGHDWMPLAAADLNNDQRADLILRNRQTGEIGVLWLNLDQSLGAIISVGSASEDVVAAGDLSGDARADIVLRDAATGAVRLVSPAPDGATVAQPYAGVPTTATFLTELQIAPPLPAPEIDFRWLGAPYTFLDARFLHLSGGFGWLSVASVSDADDGVWFYDTGLGYLWSAPGVFPAIYQLRNNFWLHYYEGTSAPRMFFNYIFGFEMSEFEL